jgi:hypothetical protein
MTTHSWMTGSGIQLWTPFLATSSFRTIRAKVALGQVLGKSGPSDRHQRGHSPGHLQRWIPLATIDRRMLTEAHGVVGVYGLLTRR